MKRWFAFLPILLLVGLAGVATLRLSQGGADRSKLFEGRERPAPELRLMTLDGDQFQLADYRGQPVMINAWATWCIPCKAEHPLLIEMQKQGVTLVGLLYKDDADAARDELERTGNPFVAVLDDSDGLAALDLGITGVPETFLVNAEGQIVFEHGRAVNRNDMEMLLDAWKALTP